MSAFKITSGKGFHLTFPNGYTLSVQFGFGNYGTNYEMTLAEQESSRSIEADTVETAWWGPDGEFVAEDGDAVQGYQTIEDVLERIKRVSSLPKKGEE